MQYGNYKKIRYWSDHAVYGILSMGPEDLILSDKDKVNWSYEEFLKKRGFDA